MAATDSRILGGPAEPETGASEFDAGEGREGAGIRLPNCWQAAEDRALAPGVGRGANASETLAAHAFSGLSKDGPKDAFQ